MIVTPRSIDRCVATLRAKIEPDCSQPTYIHTIRDVGHRFDPDPLGPTDARLRDAGVTVGPYTCAPTDGQPMDLVWAIDVLRIPACDVDGSPLPHGAGWRR